MAAPAVVTQVDHVVEAQAVQALQVSQAAPQAVFPQETEKTAPEAMVETTVEAL